MRDPKRIPEVLETLKSYWEKYPDLRLGQIVWTATEAAGYRDCFYLEDETLINAIVVLGKQPTGYCDEIFIGSGARLVCSLAKGHSGRHLAKGG